MAGLWSAEGGVRSDRRARFRLRRRTGRASSPSRSTTRSTCRTRLSGVPGRKAGSALSDVKARDRRRPVLVSVAEAASEWELRRKGNGLRPVARVCCDCDPMEPSATTRNLPAWAWALSAMSITDLLGAATRASAARNGGPTERTAAPVAGAGGARYEAEPALSDENLRALRSRCSGRRPSTRRSVGRFPVRLRQQVQRRGVPYLGIATLLDRPADCRFD